MEALIPSNWQFQTKDYYFLWKYFSFDYLMSFKILIEFDPLIFDKCSKIWVQMEPFAAVQYIHLPSTVMYRCKKTLKLLRKSAKKASELTTQLRLFFTDSQTDLAETFLTSNFSFKIENIALWDHSTSNRQHLSLMCTDKLLQYICKSTPFTLYTLIGRSFQTISCQLFSGSSSYWTSRTMFILGGYTAMFTFLYPISNSYKHGGRWIVKPLKYKCLITHFFCIFRDKFLSLISNESRTMWWT